MPKRKDVVAEQLDELLQDLRDLWVALTTDPKKQALKERAWSVLAGVFGAVATMVARRTASKAWGVLTGEQPPTARPAPRGRARPHHQPTGPPVAVSPAATQEEVER